MRYLLGHISLATGENRTQQKPAGLIIAYLMSSNQTVICECIILLFLLFLFVSFLSRTSVLITRIGWKVLKLTKILLWNVTKWGLFFRHNLPCSPYTSSIYVGWDPRGLIVKTLDCKIVESEFELLSRYYVHFWTNTLGKSMNTLIHPAMS